MIETGLHVIYNTGTPLHYAVDVQDTYAGIAVFARCQAGEGLRNSAPFFYLIPATVVAFRVAVVSEVQFAQPSHTLRDVSPDEHPYGFCIAAILATCRSGKCKNQPHLINF